MKMTGCRWLVPSLQGLLLCILALHLCVQDPCATAEHNTVANNASVAANNASVAANNASVAANNASVAATANKASVVAANNASVAATANKASVVAATANKASVVAANNASVAATANKASVVAANNALVAATTNNASVVAANNALVAATTNNASVAANNASVVAAANASVATNASVNTTEKTLLTCHSFQCSGERCYQDEAHTNETVTCHNETYCELYRLSSMNYTARCSGTCGTEMCRTNSSVSTQHCTLDCCDSPLCLKLNASSYGDVPHTTVPPTTTTTTTRAPPRNGKVCTAFSCHGDGCFKGKKTVARCIVGYDFCEMKKTGLNYMAGCSRACKAAKPVCAGGMKAACYQECCPATLKASCLRLDGKVHISSAGQVTLAPLLKLMASGVVLLLNYRVSASLWG